MKKILLISTAIILGLIIIAVLFYFYQPTNNQPSNPVEFPQSGQSGATTSPASMPKVIVATWDGGEIEVNDFENDGNTFEDPVNPDTWYIAGNLDYCNADERCSTTNSDEGYSIAYFKNEQSFSINLDSEPLGEVRMRAESRLMRVLGLGAQDMCALRYSVGTTYYVNPVYGSMGNLGFSFCPGAVQLP